MNDFAGRVALVTGAGSGLGEAIARRLLAGGARVALVDNRAERVQAVAARYDPTGGSTLSVTADVSDARAMEQAVARTCAHFGALHLAVNNAGFTGERGVNTGEYSVEEWRRVLATNLDGVFHGLRHELPALLASGGGAIVNMTSAAGIVGVEGEPAYVAAKHGIVGLTRAAALEYATRGIRVNALAPGFIATPDLLASPPEEREALAALHPMGRLGQPHEVAEFAAFLLSERAAFITGGVHVIDGGYSAR
ncbi:glucose 1-dehydrogenase [Archangium primigenium]|uniref:glucose 1-dehydrogenase n=1 Tax=[Archangium] primigenium TaxID=2792470 RepID=UPI00195B853B|nr:SDR family oxidoreductase [Archangium primigenium]